jgi:hypothetical protein
MTKWPAPTRKDHQAFCENEGWEQVRNARGQTSSHHAATYELPLRDGRILRTRISHPPNATTYGPSIWAHILRDQLGISEEEFWACARDGVRPNRGEPEVPPEALPADLVHILVTRLRLSREDIAALTRDEAIARVNDYWSQPG